MNREEMAKKAVRGLDFDATPEQEKQAAKRARLDYDEATKKQTLAPVRETHVNIPANASDQTEPYEEDPYATESDPYATESDEEEI
jgi:hypothetical protein